MVVRSFVEGMHESTFRVVKIWNVLEVVVRNEDEFVDSPILEALIMRVLKFVGGTKFVDRVSAVGKFSASFGAVAGSENKDDTIKFRLLGVLMGEDLDFVVVRYLVEVIDLVE